MTYLLAILAGAIQGLTEFLPISSTGHLIIFEKIFGISQEQFGLAFDASLHLGTLVAVLIFFFRDYLKVLNFKNGLLLKLIIGTVPAAIAGYFLEDKLNTVFRQIWIVAAGFIFFSAVLYLAEKYGKKSAKYEKVSNLNSLVIGIFQTFALLPGVSRSGSTISAGLFLGLKRDEAARFAFMLSGPIIAGAGLKTFVQVAFGGNLDSSDFNFFIVGIISSAVFGFLTIKYFLRYLSTKSLYPFIFYRVAVGLILLLVLLLNR